MSDFKMSRLTCIPVMAVAAAMPAVAVDYMSVEQAQQALFPTVKDFVSLHVKLDATRMAQVKKMAGTMPRATALQIWRAQTEDGKSAGWVMVEKIDTKEQNVSYAVAISPDGRVLGVEILTYWDAKNSHVRDPRWRAHFKGKTLADPMRPGKDIPNVAGGTLTSKSVTQGVKRMLALYSVALAHKTGAPKAAPRK